MTVDDYIDGAPEPQQSTLREVRRMLAEILPDADEDLSYGVPAFRIGGVPVAGYAYFKAHCGFYPHSGSVLSAIEPEILDGYDWAKGTLRFPIDSPPSEDLLRRAMEIRLDMIDGAAS